MISRDEPMVLVVSKDGMVRTICYLGHATLDGNEYDRVRTLAALHLCDISITTMEELSLIHISEPTD